MIAKMSKFQNLLYLYDILFKSGVVKKNKMAEELGVNPKTIARYIKDINDYLSEKKRHESIEYSRKKGGYSLVSEFDNKDTDIKNLTQKDILAISKVLIESRGFNKKEINELLQRLMTQCHNEDRQAIKKVLGNEIDNYVEPRHKSELINKIWDISHGINQQKIIEISYTKVNEEGLVDNTVAVRLLYPQGILFSEYYFYLIAFIKDKPYDYPAIYRLDRIKEYRVLKEGFTVKYKDRFKEGEFRKFVQFMQSGELLRIRFIFKGESLEAVLDRLPTAEVSKIDGGYLVEAKVFGRGIKLWLLSQGAGVEVLYPPQLRQEIIMETKRILNTYESNA